MAGGNAYPHSPAASGLLHGRALPYLLLIQISVERVVGFMVFFVVFSGKILHTADFMVRMSVTVRTTRTQNWKITSSP